MSRFAYLKLKYVASPVPTKAFFETVDLPYVGLEHITSWSGEIALDESANPVGVVSLFQPGDILFGKLRPYLAKVSLVDFHGACSTEALVLRPHRGVSARYLRYVLVDVPFIDRVTASTNGAKMPRASWEFIGAQPVPVPDLPTQEVIADFLDRETARIDELIGKKVRLMALLEERREALISISVTRGLNPYVLTTNAGPGLDAVPKHWQVLALKRVARIRYGIGEPPEYRDTGVPLIRATDISKGRINLDNAVYVDPADIPPNRIVWLAPGDVIVVRSGAYTGDSAMIREEHCPSIAGFDMVLRPIGCVPAFLQYALLSRYLKRDQIDLKKTRAAQPHLNAEELGSCLLLLPPRSEQEHIVAHLDAKIPRIDTAVERVGQSIDRLQELRSALITAAVTGQIDPDTWRKRGETDRRLEAIEGEVNG